MKLRKTTNVDDLRRMVNGMLAVETSTADGREALCVLLEAVLFQTKNYEGYKYLDTDEIAGNGTRRYYF